MTVVLERLKKRAYDSLEDKDNFLPVIFHTREKRGYNEITDVFNPIKPTGYVMHQQFNIQQLYALPTLYLCVLYLSENKQRLVPLAA